MAEWQPNPQELQQLVVLLQQSFTASTEIQKEVYNKFTEYANIPDYNSYLVVVFSKYDQEQIRIKAAILLKNNISKHYKNFAPNAQNYIQNIALQAIGDPSGEIRKYTAAILSTIVTVKGLDNSMEILEILFNLLDNSDLNLVDGAMRTILEITEDYTYQLIEKQQFANFTSSLVAKLVTFYLHPAPLIRKHAICTLFKLVRYSPNVIFQLFPTVLANSVQLSRDSDPLTRKSICSIFVAVIASKEGGPLIFNHVQDVFNLIIQFMQDEDSYVALEASDFWVRLLDRREAPHFTASILAVAPQLIPIMLKNLIYSESERLTLEADERQRNQSVDQQKDIKPRSFSSSNKGYDDYEGDDEYDDDDEDGEFGDDEPQEWTLRKCSGCGLDYLAGLLRDSLLPHLLPEIKRIMDIPNAPWYVSESVILALGAVADGCHRGLHSFLPELVAFLIRNLTNPVSFIRRITCWTVSRYAHWIVRQPHDQFFLPALESILRLSLDESKLVQQAAISAFSGILEDTHVNVLPYLSPILTTFATAINTYQISNLLILYDAIGTLCDTNKDLKRDPQLVALFSNSLMPFVMEKWRTTDNSDRAICTLCECMTAIAISLGIGFQPFAEVVFQRCLNIIDQYITLSAHDDYGMSDNAFIICPLDLLSGISEGLGPSIESLVSSSNLLGVLVHCAKQPYEEVRQVTYSLIGDLSRTCTIHLNNFALTFAEEMIKEVTGGNSPPTNNAAWAIGELINNTRDRLSPIIPRILDWLIRIINSQQLKKSLLENTAIAIGRVSSYFPDIAAPLFEHFASNWSYSLIFLRPTKDKESCYKAMCILITKNPSAVFNNNLSMIFRSIAKYGQDVSPELQSMFQQVIDYFKSQTRPDHWNALITQLQDVSDDLQNMYKVKDPIQ